MVTPLAFPPQGRPGVPGVQTGFGQVTYTDRTIGVEDTFLPGVRRDAASRGDGERLGSGNCAAFVLADGNAAIK